jgi:hypothetical protein
MKIISITAINKNWQFVTNIDLPNLSGTFFGLNNFQVTKFYSISTSP